MLQHCCNWCQPDDFKAQDTAEDMPGFNENSAECHRNFDKGEPLRYIGSTKRRMYPSMKVNDVVHRKKEHPPRYIKEVFLNKIRESPASIYH